MTVFAAPGIGKRLYLLSFLVVLALALVTAFAWTRLSGVKHGMEEVTVELVPQQLRLASIELNVTRSSLQVRHALLVRTPQDLAATLADIGAKKKAIDADRKALGDAATTDVERSQFKGLEQALDNFWAVAGQNVQLIQQDRKDEAFDMLVEKTIPARNVVLEMVAKKKGHQSDQLQDSLAAIKLDVRSTLLSLVVAVMALAAALLLFSWRIARKLKARVRAAQSIAAQVSEGDLTGAIVDHSRDEFSPLLRTLATMQTSLTRVVTQVRENSHNVAAASAQIADGNRDLSTRTQGQASALQDTAASMEQLNTTARQSTDNAQQANVLAQNASSLAARGGAVVSDVVRTMKDINDSSRKIADIVGVIDAIAFQTNILALNAAVEAARAGDQGRGFAVVASEVRTLASRSAQAAREIKTLIGASVERVEAGSALVDQAGNTMNEVVDAIHHVSDLMAQISAASGEQTRGVEHVNEAVTEMDQSTQQNAALVDQMARAAAQLNSQSQELVEAVSTFKTPVRALAL